MKHKFEGEWVGGGFLSVLQSRLSTLCCHKGEFVVTENAARSGIIKRFCCKKLTDNCICLVSSKDNKRVLLLEDEITKECLF